LTLSIARQSLGLEGGVVCRGDKCLCVTGILSVPTRRTLWSQDSLRGMYPIDGAHLTVNFFRAFFYINMSIYILGSGKSQMLGTVIMSKNSASGERELLTLSIARQSLGLEGGAVCCSPNCQLSQSISSPVLIFCGS
jgi:hypothetical protein